MNARKSEACRSRLHEDCDGSIPRGKSGTGSRGQTGRFLIFIWHDYDSFVLLVLIGRESGKLPVSPRFSDVGLL